MTTRQDTPLEDDDEAAPPDPDSLAGMFHDPGVRNYLFAGFGGLAMVFVVLFARVSDIGGLLVVLVGATGMVLRWSAAPLIVLLLLLWFLVFPDGLPPAYDNLALRRGPHVEDVVFDGCLVAAVVLYLACHYRVYGLTAHALTPEPRGTRKPAAPVRRPAALIRPGEIARLLYVGGGVVIAGQLAWLFLSTFEVDPFDDFPLRVADGRSERPALTRFLLLSGLLFFGTLAARLVFGYWRLRAMTPGEGGMMLQDAGWDETRRELVRQEGWRYWGRRAKQKKGDGR